MSDSSQQPWSDNPNAPQIPYSLYFAEKANFAGILIGAIFYGIVVVVFFQCMGALFKSGYRIRERLKWGLAAYTMAMFSFVTIFTAMNLDIQSISYIDNREFPGNDTLPPGPLGYQYLIYSKAISIVPNLMFLLNNWLADGFLLHRCYVIYRRNYWVVAFPSLMYLASFAMGITLIYQTSQPDSSIWRSVAINFGLPYFSISLSLNILLTLLIVSRLIVQTRNVRKATGTPGTSGLHKTIITVFMESSVLYAISSLLFVGPWGANSHVADIFLPILAETQVISPLLIIRRLADQSALTSDSILTGSVPNRNRVELIGGRGTLPGERPLSSADTYGKILGDQFGVGVETKADLHRDQV